MSLLKTTLVLTHVLFEIAQQNKQNYEELEAHCELLLALENLVSQIQDEVNFREVLTILVSGLERVHEGLKKLDINFGKLLFRPQPLLEKLYRFLNKLYTVTGHTLGIEPVIQDVPLDESQQIDVTQLQQLLQQHVVIDPSKVQHFQMADLLWHPASRDFWIKYFGEKSDAVDWETFKSAFEKEYGTQTPEAMKKLKKMLGVDHTTNDMVSIIEVGDFSDEFGLQESFQKLAQKATSTFNPFVEVVSPEQSETEPYPTTKSPQLQEQDLKEIQQIKENPLQVNSVWKGTCSEFACEIFDMTMHVTEHDGERIKGEIFWSGDVQTKFKGMVRDDICKFEEYKVMKGISIIPFPNNYVGKVDLKEDTIVGKWYYNDQQGGFQLRLDVDATKNLLHSEHPDEDEQDNESKIVYQSELQKQAATGLAKKWQTRYFILQGEVILYFKRRENYPKKPSGDIPISHIISIQDNPDPSRPNQFDVITEKRTYHLLAEKSEIKTAWLEAIRNQMKKYETLSMEMYNI